MIPPGTILDNRYEILDLIAEGGMGAVYRARRTRLGDEVAVKVVLPSDDSMSLRERFLRESRASASLHHPNIVSILDYSVDGEGRPFLVMELLTGPSLREEIHSMGALGAASVRRYIPPICAALQTAHDAGILHRDIKPANIVAHQFGAGERAYKLVDFGLAALKDPKNDETRLTAAFMFIGTVAYAAPEQVEGQPTDARTDVYSLAAVVYEMLTGRAPYGTGGVYATLAQQATSSLVAPSKARPDVPPELDEIVLRGLARDPSARWPSAIEFGLALTATEASTTTSTHLVTGGGGFTSRYDVGKMIARGRLGSSVYAGVHRALGHPVAIRTRHRGAEPHWDAIRSRFLKEAKALQVTHPAVLQVRDFGEEGDVLYVVTELVEGESLRETIAAGPLPWNRLRQLVAQLADAAATLARRGAIICGLSPEIIRMSREGNEERILISAPGIHQLGDILATADEATLRGTSLDPELRYVPLEVLTGGAPDPRSDVFTLGVLAYEMATGSPPFDAATLPALIGQILRSDAPDPRLLAPSLPEKAAAIIRTSLAREPGDRFESTAALRQAWAQVYERRTVNRNE
ncbi:MAG TPA: serine/threonine-protein kinase [Vicinamibacterales bacterium]|nr:serine/threonine-protein kinase [Vicinamibacterales bacterium]